jgi:hypothetical protein
MRNEAARDLFSKVCAFDAERAEAEATLVKHGAAAVPFLVSQISDPKHGWQAVRLLGEIGPEAASCADVLHHELWHATTEPGRAWPARALAKIGRLDLVLPLFDDDMPSLHAPPAYPTGHYCWCRRCWCCDRTATNSSSAAHKVRRPPRCANA